MIFIILSFKKLWLNIHVSFSWWILLFILTNISNTFSGRLIMLETINPRVYLLLSTMEVNTHSQLDWKKTTTILDLLIFRLYTTHYNLLSTLWGPFLPPQFRYYTMFINFFPILFCYKWYLSSFSSSLHNDIFLYEAVIAAGALAGFMI